MNPRRRTNDFIDPEVQGALARRVSLHWVLYTAVAAVLVVGLKCMADPFTPVWDHLVQAWQAYGTLLMVLLALAPVFVFDAIRLSNRFSGPIMRISNATRALANGERPDPINLREGDFWSDLADDFNRVIERLPAEGDSETKAKPS